MLKFQLPNESCKMIVWPCVAVFFQTTLVFCTDITDFVSVLSRGAEDPHSVSVNCREPCKYCTSLHSYVSVDVSTTVSSVRPIAILYNVVSCILC